MQKGSKRKSIVIDLTLTSEDESSEGGDEIFIDVYNERRLIEFVKENNCSGVEQLLKFDYVKVEILKKKPTLHLRCTPICSAFRKTQNLAAVTKCGS